jgi:hypothetical protein
MLFSTTFSYTLVGRVKITDENCVPLLSLANALEIEDLKKRIANFLSTSINRKNAMFVLHKALEFNTGLDLPLLHPSFVQLTVKQRM